MTSESNACRVSFVGNCAPLAKVIPVCISLFLLNVLASRKKISCKTLDDLVSIERSHPGTLLSNCSYESWRRRYKQSCVHSTTRDPWALTGPLEQPVSDCSEDLARHISRWAIRCPMFEKACLIFGCTEDITCQSASMHDGEYDKAVMSPPVLKIKSLRC